MKKETILNNGVIHPVVEGGSMLKEIQLPMK